MRAITGQNLRATLASHRKWVRGDADGKRANLSGANMRWADLVGADLTGANLHEADLRWADLSVAYLSGANLTGANLHEADLTGAILSGANLSVANLSGADLTGANMRWANLRWANLSSANLIVANLIVADLRDTVLDPRRRPADATEALLAGGIRIADGIAYGWRTRASVHVGSAYYTPGRYCAPYFSTCTKTECHPGIYFASREWLRDKGYVDIVPCATWVSCVCAAAGKFRTKELWVFDEADERWSAE